MTEHTPGPWRVRYRYGQGLEAEALIQTSDGADIATLMFNYRKEADADAALIAAAPDLLEVCEMLLGQIENRAEGLDLCIENWPNVKKARAAIAQAKGEIGGTVAKGER